MMNRIPAERICALFLAFLAFLAGWPLASTAQAPASELFFNRMPEARAAEASIEESLPQCMAVLTGDLCRLEVSNRPDCYILDYSRGLLSGGASWSGKCKDGKPDGEGVIIRRYQEGSKRKVDSYEGRYVYGDKNGRWVMRYASGEVHEGPVIDGLRNGHWVERHIDGTVTEGPYVGGTRNGPWIVYYVNKMVEKGNLDDNVRVGVWEIRYANGDCEYQEFISGSAGPKNAC